MCVRGWKINPASIRIGIFIAQTVRARANDASKYDVIIEVELVERMLTLILELRQNTQFRALKRRLESIRKSNTVTVPIIAGRLNHHTNRPRWMNGFTVRTSCLDTHHDPRAG